MLEESNSQRIFQLSRVVAAPSGTYGLLDSDEDDEDDEDDEPDDEAEGE